MVARLAPHDSDMAQGARATISATKTWRSTARTATSWCPACSTSRRSRACAARWRRSSTARASVTAAHRRLRSRARPPPGRARACAASRRRTGSARLPTSSIASRGSSPSSRGSSGRTFASTARRSTSRRPRYGSPVEWHQDWAFYPHTNDDLLAVGVMLDDCTLENGPLLVVPGATPARSGTITPTATSAAPSIPRAIEAEIARAVPLTGRAGSMSFHHVRLLHGSAQNVSDQPARAPALRVRRGRRVAAAWACRTSPTSTPASSPASRRIEPRVTPAPVRLPLPPALHQGSIYENQSDASRRYFAVTEPAEEPAQTWPRPSPANTRRAGDRPCPWPRASRTRGTGGGSPRAAPRNRTSRTGAGGRRTPSR